MQAGAQGMTAMTFAVIAANRFGYGETDAAAATAALAPGGAATREAAMAAVLAQLRRFEPAPPAIAALEATPAILARGAAARAEASAARRAARGAPMSSVADERGDDRDDAPAERPRATPGTVAPSEGSVARDPDGDDPAAAERGAQVGKQTGAQTGSEAGMGTGRRGPAEPRTPQQRLLRDLRDVQAAQIAARLAVAATSRAPFAERMVAFWSNHFAVTNTSARMVGLGGRLELEAIRPRITGRFADLLQAAVLHPAMLTYLNQEASVGPQSDFARQRAGAAARRGADVVKVPGLNENLAREILELHTLGTGRAVGGGGGGGAGGQAAPYGQGDVTELARVLTGHVVEGRVPGAKAPMVREALARAADAGGGGSGAGMRGALFVEALHEPGPRTILGQRFDQPGADQARAVLAMLAVHPATARHLSFKLARHFVADDPPEPLVARLAARWVETGGDLSAWMEALVRSPEAWATTRAKVRDPWDWLVGAARVLGPMKPISGELAGRWLRELGQPVWRSGSPQGYGDTAADWLAPDALIRRADIAPMVARAAAGVPDLRRIGPAAAGVAPAGPTMAMLDAAADPVQAAALFLMSPEFLRR